MSRTTKDNRVIIRIWSSSLDKGENVGHVSIETPHRYMSLWPDNKEDGLGIVFPIEKEFKLNADADIKEEDRVSEKIFCLYSLDTSAMETRFNNIKDDKDFKGWTLIGSNLFINKGNAHSCASLAYAILLAGDIYDLLPKAYSTSFSTIVAPDLLGVALNKAKQVELSRYPDTSKYGFFERIAIINGKNYTEQEIFPNTQNAYSKSRACIATTIAAVGIFAIGVSIYKKPETISNYWDSFKSHFSFS